MSSSKIVVNCNVTKKSSLSKLFYLWAAVLFYFCVLNTRIAAAAADQAELPDNNEEFTQTTSNNLAIGAWSQASRQDYGDS